MRRGILVLIFSLSLIFLVEPVHAGVSLGTGGITISAGQSVEVCDVWIYATQEGGTYNVETTGDLQSMTTSITPNDFTLDPIECPGETSARRACISQLCMSEDQSSCKVVCLTFTAPTLIEWNPQNVVYDGAILNSIKIGAATIKEPYEFSIHVKPMDMKPIAFAIAVAVVIIVVLLVLLMMRKWKK